MDIVLASKDEWKQVRRFYAEVTADLLQRGIKQWDRWYPNRWVLKQDLQRGELYTLREGEEWLGTVVVNGEQSSKYESIPWKGDSRTAGVIHRLAVHPGAQGRGIGKTLLHFAENFLYNQGYRSIRLDAHTGNPIALSFYERAGYSARGLIRFPLRKQPYQCFEKIWKE